MTPQKWAFQLTHILNAYAGPDRFPVDVKSLARDYSHQKYPDDPVSMIKGAPLPTFDGGLYKAPPGKKGWGIIYNDSMQSKGRINYTLAHEFGHYLLHRNDYPNGIECGEQDLVRWDSDYGQIEHQANVFAANLLMPLDDYRNQIAAKTKVDLDMIGGCADRYGVSLTAAILRWIEYTERRAVIVVSRDGFILWARSSKAAFRTGIYIKTAGRPPVAVPQNSLAGGLLTSENQRVGIILPAGVWFKESCEEMVVFSEQYDFTISVLQLDQEPDFFTNTNGYGVPTSAL
ncbi:ImmA/IrrE family metallo-endopeptidase [Microbulbifer sp. CnH-101-G]